MAGGTIDFNGGGTLASLGFIDIQSGLANVAGVGEGGTYGMQSTSRYSEAGYPVTPAAAPLCLTFWWNRTITDGSIYLVEVRAGAAMWWNVTVQVESGNNNLFIESRAGWSDYVTNFWPTSFPAVVRIQIVPSVGGTFAAPAADGVIKIWHGPDVNNLTLHYDHSDVEIYDFTKDAQAAYAQFQFAPQGVIDSIVWGDAICGPSSPPSLDPPPRDVTSPECCDEITGQTTPPAPPPPDNPIVPGVTDSCVGTGLGPNGTNPSGGEVWLF